MDREDIERLVRVEEGLQEVRNDLKDFKDSNEKRLDELKNMVHVIADRPDIAGFLLANWKSIATIVLLIIGIWTGATPVAEALSALLQ